MKRIILTTADAQYVDVLKVFLMSMRLHGNSYKIRADLINYSDEQVERLKNIYPLLEENRIQIANDCESERRLLLLMRTRPKQMWKALNEDWEQVMSMVCDIIIRGDISGIWDGVDADTFKIFLKKKKNDRTCMQGGVYLFGNSENIRNYYREIMDTIGEDFGFWDGQEALCTVLKNYTDVLRFKKLDRTYNDERKLKMSKKSLVWHCKHGRIGLGEFEKEFRVYLKEANKYYDS